MPKNFPCKIVDWGLCIFDRGFIRGSYAFLGGRKGFLWSPSSVRKDLRLEHRRILLPQELPPPKFNIDPEKLPFLKGK